MLFTTPINLLLALAPATIFAAPTPTIPTLANLFDLERRGLSSAVVKALSNGGCDLSKVSMPTAPTPLPLPAAGLTLSHIALGRGIQNYTCVTPSAKETPVAVGAIAQLFNATCSYPRAPTVVDTLPHLALSYPVPSGAVAQEMLSGHHEFNAAGTPYFSLKTEAHDYGDVNVKKNASSSAPAGSDKGRNGMGSVTWLKLVASSEGSYKEVYRLNTAGGQAPATCDGMPGQFSVEYAAEYWFWH
ncbi:hypothetical protein GQ43DRAFT_103021 [Delitschia confertaspora ATCC 74209]|uniref:Malate dehydrogenase n=1 Tax=Delitschia confertaspora ATCC 74209 TaxID=1513339 RepID=A0A9P4JST7_9PLEO|nr:hypothetical protein GQ43DRAFT_103021 [Delitschia confertaspora ATCC 74209]